MVTIKDVASDTGLSPSTVSIVLKGNGNKRKITENTQQKVLESARRLGYKPNIQAKVLRGGISDKSIITLFWASDIRVHMLSRFINGLQSALLANQYQCELQIKPYDNNHLDEAMNEHTFLSCNGIIICNPSENDMSFLDHLNVQLPIVLYNRYSSKYATVNMDDKTIGSLPASVFIRHERKRPAIIKAPATFNGMNIRTNMFEFLVHESGMEPPVSLTVNDSMQGGYNGAKKLCRASVLPDCLFCTSDSIALGALKAFYEKGIRIPDDIEIISVGNGNPDQEEYSIPSLSVIKLPMEEMAAACLKKVYRSLSSFNYIVDTEEFPIQYIARESCPE